MVDMIDNSTCRPPRLANVKRETLNTTVQFVITFDLFRFAFLAYDLRFLMLALRSI